MYICKYMYIPRCWGSGAPGEGMGAIPFPLLCSMHFFHLDILELFSLN